MGRYPGRDSQTIVVQTNDPLRRKVRLHVSAQVQVLLFAPKKIRFGKVFTGSEAVRDFFVTASDNSSVKITSIETDNKFVKAEAVSGGENDKNKKVRVTMLAGLKPGKFRGKITVYTDHELIKQISVVVSGKVLSNFDVRPERQLSFGRFKKGKRVEGAIKIRSLIDRDFKITGVEVPVPGIETRVETVKEAREYRVIVVLTEDLTMPLLHGKTVTITTDDENQRKLEVVLMGRMKK